MLLWGQFDVHTVHTAVQTAGHTSVNTVKWQKQVSERCCAAAELSYSSVLY
jgi:hypothetical protein